MELKAWTVPGCEALGDHVTSTGLRLWHRSRRPLTQKALEHVQLLRPRLRKRGQLWVNLHGLVHNRGSLLGLLGRLHRCGLRWGTLLGLMGHWCVEGLRAISLGGEGLARPSFPDGPNILKPSSTGSIAGRPGGPAASCRSPASSTDLLPVARIQGESGTVFDDA